MNGSDRSPLQAQEHTTRGTIMFSMTEDRWRDLKSGVGCPFCGDRPAQSPGWSKVAALAVTTLYLQKAQTYRGYSVLVFDPRHATRLSGRRHQRSASAIEIGFGLLLRA